VPFPALDPTIVSFSRIVVLTDCRSCRDGNHSTYDYFLVMFLPLTRIEKPRNLVVHRPVAEIQFVCQLEISLAVHI